MSRRLALRGAAIGVLIAVAGVYLSRILADPKVPFLIPEGGAQWIRFDRSFSLSAQSPRRGMTSFRKRIALRQQPSSAVLTVRAFKAAKIFVDGQLVLDPQQGLGEWKRSRHVDLAPYLPPGTHVVSIAVSNENGPSALLAYCEPLDLRTRGDWEASRDGRTWTPAKPADAPSRPVFYASFPTSLESLRASVPVLAPVFVIVFVVTLWWTRYRTRFARLGRPAIAPGRIRWALLGAYGLLWANDLFKVPLNVGFDAGDHFNYIRFVAQKGRIPLATDGWQMFQSPLYYLVSAPLYAVFQRLFGLETAIRLLRVVPLACGLAQIHLNYLIARRVFPKRADLQGLATFIGGLLPINLYLSQALGNEPMAGVLTSVVILATFSLGEEGRLQEPTRPLLVLGALLGLALLAKVTAILLVPLVLLYVANALRAARYSVRQATQGIVTILAATFLVAGWYYLRNWVQLGTPFVGGWETGRGFAWWQDPGYRTPWQFLAFGASLIRPVYSGTDRFWDAFYSSLWSDGFLSGILSFEFKPPWNYDFLTVGALLALVPTVAMVAGVLCAFRGACWLDRKRLLFAVGALAIYLAAMLRLFLVLPVYSTVKATYTIGLLPCYAALGAAGLGMLLRGPVPRATGYGLIACWGVSCYLAYFAR